MVSVIVPVFDRKVELERAVQSVISQTYQTWELIIVDDASTDDVWSGIAELSDPRIRFMRLDKNRGAGAARNAGIVAATGKWVAFLDSDDEWMPHKLATQVAALEGSVPRLHAICCGYEIRHFREEAPRVFRPTPALTNAAAFAWGCSLCPGSTLVVERACFAEIGLFDPALRRFEDWDWLLRLTRRYAVGADPTIMAVIHKGGMPARSHVLESLSVLRQKQAQGQFGGSSRFSRRFRSSLLIEEAAIAYYGGKMSRMIFCLFHAIMICPRRDLRFFTMLARRLVGLVSARLRAATAKLQLRRKAQLECNS